jgi:hypothetical protein
MDKTELKELRAEFKEMQQVDLRADSQRNGSEPRQWRVVGIWGPTTTQSFCALAARASSVIGQQGYKGWLEHLTTIERPDFIGACRDGETQITLETLNGVARLSVLAIDGLLAAPDRPDSKQETQTIPVNQRTKPMSLADAGMALNLAPQGGSKSSRREAAAKAVRRLIDSGGLDAEQMGRKFVFDRTKVPE